jgi:hypothetical protein
MLMAAGQEARAQNEPPPWFLNGSDTWFDVITEALVQADETCEPTGPEDYDISNLRYAGGGSSTAERNMQNNLQSIGPMSRNLKQAVMDAHPDWVPTIRNVGGLDAGIIITKKTDARCRNLDLSLRPGYPTEADYNDPDVEPFNFGETGSGYTQIMAVVLGGIDGSGSVEACASPRRIQAIQDLAACQGVETIEHFYRRDDNSGTTDTFREKLKVGNFCNGRARGIKGTNSIDPDNDNLNNQDLDPIRRPCPPANPDHLATTCTDMTTGLACTHGDGNPNCTQGLVVALSSPDPGQTDVTVSIGVRVGADEEGSLMGFAGREGAYQPNATAPSINNNNYSDALVRLDQYMLSRRLFIQHGSDITDEGPGAGGAAQLGTELKFWNWMTDDVGANCNGVPGRCNLDPILRQFGFVPCTDDCMTPAGPGNLCAAEPYPPSGLPPGLPTKKCIPAYTDGTAWGYDEVACQAGQTCCSTVLECPVSGICPAVGNLPENSACTEDADCASGLSCGDFLGIRINTCG